MYLLIVRILLTVAFTISLSDAYAALPCDGIDRSLTHNQKAALSVEIAKQLDISSVDVLESLREKSWSIILVDTHQSDSAFLFFPDDPLKNHYITEWGGAAGRDEERQIEDWTIKNAPGIPVKLAKCFAWHVTHDRSN